MFKNLLEQFLKHDKQGCRTRKTRAVKSIPQPIMVQVQLVDPRGALLPQPEIVETPSSVSIRRYSADRYTYESYSCHVISKLNHGC
jgi:hypothetical protein